MSDIPLAVSSTRPMVASRTFSFAWSMRFPGSSRSPSSLSVPPISSRVCSISARISCRLGLLLIGQGAGVGVIDRQVCGALRGQPLVVVAFRRHFTCSLTNSMFSRTVSAVCFGASSVLRTCLHAHGGHETTHEQCHGSHDQRGEPRVEARIDQPQHDRAENHQQAGVDQRASRCGRRRATAHPADARRDLDPREVDLLADDRADLAAEVTEQRADAAAVLWLAHLSCPRGRPTRRGPSAHHCPSCGPHRRRSWWRSRSGRRSADPGPAPGRRP